jgi:hypothetical protein
MERHLKRILKDIWRAVWIGFSWLSIDFGNVFHKGWMTYILQKSNCKLVEAASYYVLRKSASYLTH